MPVYTHRVRMRPAHWSQSDQWAKQDNRLLEDAVRLRGPRKPKKGRLLSGQSQFH